MKLLKEALLRENIVKTKMLDEEPFTLKSGKKSRLFIDIKQASLNPGLLNLIINTIISNGDSPAFLDMCYKNSNVSDYYILNYRIGSVAVGGVPIGILLSHKTHIHQIIIRSEKHDRGTQTKIICDCKDKNVLLIEDVATSGGSIISAVKLIREAGGICNNCIVIVDREEGAKEWCKQNDINLIPLLRKLDFGIKEEL